MKKNLSRVLIQVHLNSSLANICKALENTKIKNYMIHRKKNKLKTSFVSPGWCGSVEGVLTCEPKGHQFSSQSRAYAQVVGGSPVGGVQKATTLIFLSLSPCLPLSKNK